MPNDIKKYLTLQNALLNEKEKIEARLKQISEVIGQDGPVAASAPASRGGKRKFSEATKAKMRAAQQARWAKVKGRAGKPAATTAPKKKRKMSVAGRAAIAAAAKARWAKAKAAGKKTLGG